MAINWADVLSGKQEDARAKKARTAVRQILFGSDPGYAAQTGAFSIYADIDPKSDSNIDAQTRGELLDLLAGGHFGSARDLFAQATSGNPDPKFKSRKAIEEFYKTIIDRPGSRQTRGDSLSSLYSSNTSSPGARGLL